MHVAGAGAALVGPFPPRDGEAMQTVVTFRSGAEGWNALPDAADELRDTASVGGAEKAYLTAHPDGC